MKKLGWPCVAVGVIGLVAICGDATAGRAFPCVVKGAPKFTAEISNERTDNRSVQVDFAKKPTAADATKVVQACVKLAATGDPDHDAVGTAWANDKQVTLSGGGPYAYEHATKSYRFVTGALKLTPK